MSPLVATALTAPTGERRCNSGFGRRPQQRTSIRASLLGDTGGPAGCPLVLSAALDFGGADPVAAVYALLAEAGIDNPEHLRRHCEHPAEPCICRPSGALQALPVGDDERPAVLRQVLLLGLSTAHHYDPARPVLLTHSSLTRRLQLFTGRGFYA
jgi:hypothetical protein